MSSEYRFNCGSCGASIIVDYRVRAGVIEDGCPICLGPATEHAFEIVESEDANPSA